MKKNKKLFVFVAIFCLLGVITIAQSFADTRSPIVNEAESYSSITSADVVSDPQASDGSYIAFRSSSERGVFCRNVTVTATNQPNGFLINAEIIGNQQPEAMEISFGQVDPGYPFTTGDLYSSIDRVAVSGLPANYTVPANEYQAGLHDVWLTTSGDNIASRSCVARFDSSTSSLDQLACSIEYQLGASSREHHFDIYMGELTDQSTATFFDGFSLNNTHIDQSQVQANIIYPDTVAGSVYIPYVATSNSSLGWTDQQWCFIDIVVLPDDSGAWKDIAGIDLLSPEQYVSQLQPGVSIDQTIAVLDDYFEERYNRSVSLGYEPVVKRVNTTEFDPFAVEVGHVTLLDRSSPEHVEKMRIFAHTVLDTWSRIPLAVSSALAVEEIRYAAAFPWVPAQYTCAYNGPGTPSYCAGNSALEYGFVNWIGWTDTVPQVPTSYDLFLQIHSHEIGHDFENYLGKNGEWQDCNPFCGMFFYPPFTDANPPWFTAYGDRSLIQYNSQLDPIGFTSDYATTNQAEDIADTFSVFFARGEWAKMLTRINSQAEPDPYLKAKIDDVLSQLQRLEPDLNHDTLLQLGELPSYAPSL